MFQNPYDNNSIFHHMYVTYKRRRRDSLNVSVLLYIVSKLLIGSLCYRASLISGKYLRLKYFKHFNSSLSLSYVHYGLVSVSLFLCYMHFLCVFAVKIQSLIRQQQKSQSLLRTHTKESLAKSHFSRVLFYIQKYTYFFFIFLNATRVASSSDFFLVVLVAG